MAETIVLKDLLATVLPAYGETWAGARTMMMGDIHERRRVEELEKELLTRGLSDPILILVYDDDEDEHPGEHWVANGTHRVVAAWNLGLETVPVVRTQKWEAQETYYKTTDFVFSITKESFSAVPEGDREELSEKIFDCLTSSGNFRLNEETWVETMSCGSTGRGTYTEYNLGLFPVDEKFHLELAARLVEQISCCVPKDLISWPEVANRTHFDSEFFA